MVSGACNVKFNHKNVQSTFKLIYTSENQWKIGAKVFKKQQNKTITLTLIHQKVLRHLTSLLTIATNG